MEERYNGKNAWYFYGIVIGYNIFPVLLGVNDLKGNLWIAIVFILYYLGDLIFIPVMVRNYLVLYDDYFEFCYGFGKDVIKLADIKKIEKSRNPIAASANSLDRIYIASKDKELFISLKENDRFIKTVMSRMEMIL